jgi:hypothetical protein
MNIYALRPKIHEAVYLWILLNTYAQSAQEEWVQVSGGSPVSDAELASYLICPEDRRVRLEDVGLIRCQLVGQRARSIELRNLHFSPDPEEKKNKDGIGELMFQKPQFVTATRAMKTKG